VSRLLKRYAECHDHLNVMLSVFMLNVVMLNVIMLIVVMLNVIMESVVAPNQMLLNT
jgi:hypothetical protein